MDRQGPPPPGHTLNKEHAPQVHLIKLSTQDVAYALTTTLEEEALPKVMLMLMLILMHLPMVMLRWMSWWTITW